MKGELYKRFELLDGTALKLIAMLSMILDHVSDSFFPDLLWMRALGRMAMPIFAFCVSEGYIHTCDRVRYLLRLFIFGLISEVPFDLFANGKLLEFSHQNIMFSFAWAVLGLMCIEKALEKNSPLRGRILAALILADFMIGALLMRLDYDMLAVALVSAFTLLRERPLWIRNTASAAVYAVFRNVGRAWFGLLGFVPIYFYNGKRGRGFKWLFYVFYPAHLLAIYLIRQLLI